jgi:hypothetical protein
MHRPIGWMRYRVMLLLIRSQMFSANDIAVDVCIPAVFLIVSCICKQIKGSPGIES